MLENKGGGVVEYGFDLCSERKKKEE